MAAREENLAKLRSSVREIAPGQKFSVEDFDPQDAPGIAALFYAVYGESFAIDSVYDPEHYVKASAAGQMHLVVGRTESGDVVGLHAYFRSPPGKNIMELGSWMVLPSYRKTSVGGNILQYSLGDKAAKLALHVIYTQNVCDHLISQKASDKYAFRSCAIQLEAMPPRPEAATEGAAGRISLIDAFIVRQDTPHAVRLPDPYAEALRKIYASRGLERHAIDDGQPTGMTVCAVETMDGASLARMTIKTIGADVAQHPGAFVRDYPDRHIHQIVIPLTDSGVSQAVRAAREAGFFLGGLLPLWDDRDMLLMQRLSSEPDLAKVQLYTEEVKELFELVAADRKAVAAGRF